MFDSEDQDKIMLVLFCGMIVSVLMMLFFIFLVPSPNTSKYEELCSNSGGIYNNEYCEFYTDDTYLGRCFIMIINDKAYFYKECKFADNGD